MLRLTKCKDNDKIIYRLIDSSSNEICAVADDPFCGTTPIDINYCPMCSRSLKVVNKLRQIESDFNGDKSNESNKRTFR